MTFRWQGTCLPRARLYGVKHEDARHDGERLEVRRDAGLCGNEHRISSSVDAGEAKLIQSQLAEFDIKLVGLNNFITSQVGCMQCLLGLGR
eukprot:9238371-Heterocapsa_arctica.AAC.1